MKNFWNHRCFAQNQFGIDVQTPSGMKCGLCGHAAPISATQDNVNHPAHYTSGGIECIDAIKAALTPEEFRGFLKGNVIKYAWRERLKGGVESLKKAAWYLNKLTGEK